MAPLYKLLTVALTVAALGATASCQSTTSGGAVGADRQQFLLVSSEQLNQMAAKAYNQLQAESAKKGTLNTDPALTKRVRAIATRITPQTRVFRADAPGWKWEVNTITSKQLNAFCMPGGKIMFYSGLIQNLKLSDDEIAVEPAERVVAAGGQEIRRFDEAVEALKKNTELQPMSPFGWYQLARVHVDRQQPDEAVKIIRHLNGFEPKVAAQLERETGLRIAQGS